MNKGAFSDASIIRLSRVELTLIKRTVEALQPEDKPWIAWDDTSVMSHKYGYESGGPFGRRLRTSPRA